MTKIIHLKHDQVEPLEEILMVPIDRTILDINNTISSIKEKLNHTNLLLEEMDRILVKNKL